MRCDTYCRERLCRLFGRLGELQLSFRGNAELSLHTRTAPDTPKMRAEYREDGVTVDLEDVLLIGVLMAGVGGVVSCLKDIWG